jgi:hypothetical protein
MKEQNLPSYYQYNDDGVPKAIAMKDKIIWQTFITIPMAIGTTYHQSYEGNIY